jgi:hypothetical protein
LRNSWVKDRVKKIVRLQEKCKASHNRWALMISWQNFGTICTCIPTQMLSGALIYCHFFSLFLYIGGAGIRAKHIACPTPISRKAKGCT